MFKDGPHTHGCHNTTYQQAVGSHGIGALRGGAGAYFSYKQCIKQKTKISQKCGKNVFILSPVKLFESERRRATIVRACACERKSLGFKETGRRRHFRNGEGEGMAALS